MADLASLFREARLRRNMAQKHKPCPKCSGKRSVCQECTKVVCKECGHECVAETAGEVRRTGTDHRDRAQVRRAASTSDARSRQTRKRVPTDGRSRTDSWPVDCRSVHRALRELGADGLETDTGGWRAVWKKCPYPLTELVDRLGQCEPFHNGEYAITSRAGYSKPDAEASISFKRATQSS